MKTIGKWMLLTAALGLGVGCSGGSGDPDGGPTDAPDAGGGSTLYRGVLPDDVHALGFALAKSGDKIVAVGSGARDGGTTGGELFVGRFDGEGRLDSSFGTGGVALVDGQGTEQVQFLGKLNSDGAYAVIADGDDLVVAGAARAWAIPGGASLMLGRLLPNGAMDPSFGNLAGLRLDTFRNASNEVIEAAYHQVLRQPNGKYLAGGTVQGNFWAARYNADGSADTTFSKTGMGFGAAYGSQFENEIVRSMVLQASGKLVVAGGDGFHAMRYNADGTQDTAFGTSGFFRRSGGTQYAMVERADGRLLHLGGGSEQTGGTTVLKVVMYLTDADGQPDTTFGTAGRQEVTVPVNIIRGVAQAADGSVLLYLSGGGTWLARLTPDLELDTAFGPDEGLLKLDIRLPILQPLIAGSNHLLVDGNAAWIADISQEKYAEPDKTRSFFVLRKYGL